MILTHSWNINHCFSAIFQKQRIRKVQFQNLCKNRLSKQNPFQQTKIKNAQIEAFIVFQTVKNAFESERTISIFGRWVNRRVRINNNLTTTFFCCSCCFPVVFLRSRALLGNNLKSSFQQQIVKFSIEYDQLLGWMIVHLLIYKHICIREHRKKRAFNKHETHKQTE